MRKYLLTLLMFICLSPAIIYGQIIKGTVLEKNTGNPIGNALVYFNGTSVGTYTDENGFFTLDISKFGLMPLTISALGYNSVTLKDFSTDKPLTIYLPLKVFGLNEVIVSDKGNPKLREDNLTLFKKIFLGTTENAATCRINNENDIIIFQVKDTLRAYSLKPILVNNRALGYEIIYYLDKFEFIEKTETYDFTGNIIFRDEMATIIRQEVIERRRRREYLGSKMHFFRALWENNLDSARFLITNPSKVRLNYSDIVVESKNSLSGDPNKYLKYGGKLRLSYLPRNQISFIDFKKDSVYFYRNGYFDGEGIIWEGTMEEKRIADMLSYDYFYPEK